MAKNEYAMTLKEASELTGISILTLRKLIEKKEIPGVCLITECKNYYWIPRKAFMKFLESWDTTENKKMLSQLLDDVTTIKKEIENLKRE